MTESPADSVIRWAERAIGPDANVQAVRGMRAGGSPWLLRVERPGSVVRFVLKTGAAGQREELATEAAALAFAEKCGLPVPTLIAADLDGEQAGGLAVLFTCLEGTADVPADATPERLRALGRAAAGPHLIPLAPTDELPLRKRHMPWIDFSEMRRTPGEERTALLDRADELVRTTPEPAAPTVFVHADLWQGNTMWVGDNYVGMIDWEAAGAGNYGVDLGSLRLDTALLHGVDRAGEILSGWEDAAGRSAENVAYWDLVAAINTRADMTGFLPAIHEASRTDLDGQTLTARRDAFLKDALARIQ